MLRLPRLPRLTRFAPNVWRRTAAAALVALQAVIAVSPVLEQRDEVRPYAHVEAQGSRHLAAHDEETCTVCTVRTLLGDVPAEPAALITTATTGRVAFSYEAVVGSTGLALDNHSRAPPALG